MIAPYDVWWVLWTSIIAIFCLRYVQSWNISFNEVAFSDGSLLEEFLHSKNSNFQPQTCLSHPKSPKQDFASALSFGFGDVNDLRYCYPPKMEVRHSRFPRSTLEKERMCSLAKKTAFSISASSAPRPTREVKAQPRWSTNLPTIPASRSDMSPRAKHTLANSMLSERHCLWVAGRIL